MTILKNKVFVFLFCVFLILGNVKAGDSSVIDKINISPTLKKNIMQSPFKIQLQKNDGKKIVAYLYADNEHSEAIENYSCINGEPQNLVSKMGRYYIYLYDVNSGTFLSRRTKVFNGFDELRFNIEGAELIVLSGAKEKKSDVLLISQFGDCNGNFFEAYGFSKNNSNVENYIFVTKQKKNQFYGKIGKGKIDSEMIAYGLYGRENDKIQKMSVHLSNKNGEIWLQPVS